MVSNAANTMDKGTSDGQDRKGRIGPESSPSTGYVPFSEPAGSDDGNDTEAQKSVSPPPTTSNKTKSVKQHLDMFWAMSLPYFRESGEARCLFAGLIILMFTDSAGRIFISFLARDFWSALGDKDADLFYSVMKRFLLILCFVAPITVLYRFQRQRLAIRWRKWMTERILQLYFYTPHRVYYRLEQGGRQNGAAPMGASEKSSNDNFVDNPDQRLAEDVRSFTQYSLSLILTIAISIIDLTAFSIVLYTIEPKLFLAIISFAAIGTLATFFLGRDLVRLNFLRLSREADFRYSLVRIRENAESIAFFRGEETEGREVQRRFDGLIANLYAVIGTQRNLEFFTVSYNYLTWILPVVVIAPQYMAGLVDLGVVQQAAAAFGHVLDDLSLIINEFEGLSEFSASIGRLHQFMQAIKDADSDRGEMAPLMALPSPGGGDDDDDYGASARAKKDGIFKKTPKSPGMAKRSVPLNRLSREQISSSEENICLRELPPMSETFDTPSSALSIRGLYLWTPNPLSDSTTQLQRRTLISNLDLELRWGQKLLIVGSSGIGKSSLLRAIAGLWKSGSGRIERTHAADVYFLPQKPYCPLGTLRDQLLYPFHSGSKSSLTDGVYRLPKQNKQQSDDSELLEILASVDLPDLAKRSGNGDPFRGLDTLLDWGNVLSLGEQQRLAFGRILVHKPRLVILDEATSAMDVPAETKLYGLLKTSTCVSVGHRPTLLKYHDTMLKLHKHGDTSDNNNNPLSNHSSKGNYTVGPIRSTADGIASEEVDLFFR